MPSFPNKFTSKLPQIGTTIFAQMSKLAADNNAINLSQGFPDFKCDPRITGLVNDAMQKGYNQYAPMPGIHALREQIAIKTEFLYSASYDVDSEITVTAGATQAIFTAIQAFVNTGDEVIIFEPAYDCYGPAISLAGGIPVYVSLKHPDYSIDWEHVQKLIRNKTRMIILNSPHNPSGAVLNAMDMQKLQKIIRNTNIILISDEVYEHIIFDGKEHQSVARYPELANRSIIVSSFGKTYHTTGWKLGYVVAPKELMVEFRKVHQFLVFSVSTPMQWAYSEILKHKELFLELSAFYQQKRNYFSSHINGSKFKLLPCPGTYFQLLDYSAISKEKDTQFAIRLTEEYKLASIPASVFYHKPIDNCVLRFCFAKENETLEKAAEIIQNIF